jgi:hypothetical protein
MNFSAATARCQFSFFSAEKEIALVWIEGYDPVPHFKKQVCEIHLSDFMAAEARAPEPCSCALVSGKAAWSFLVHSMVEPLIKVKKIAATKPSLVVNFKVSRVRF